MSGAGGPECSPLTIGANVAGLLRSELGLGEAARSVVTALDAAGVALLPVHGRSTPVSRQSREFACVRPVDARHPVNIVCINPGELPSFVDEAGASFRASRHTIGFWWWEGSRFPARWQQAFELVDEVWVGSDYVASVIRAATALPVNKLRVPVSMPPVARRPRGDLGLPEGYLFMFAFDFQSGFTRKNPLGTIAAFAAAFPPGSGASLLIKCTNHGSEPGDYAALLEAVAGHPDVHVLARHVSPREWDAMLAACDCYVSLHRAEGFALTAAEAMCLGKPVIATAYSGNLEFMTEANSYLVDYDLVEIQNVKPPYRPGDGVWAAPRIDEAARLMRQVFEHRAESGARALRGAEDLAQWFSPRACGRAMRARLEEIAAASSPAPMQSSSRSDERGRPPASSAFATIAEAWRTAIRWIALWQALRAMRASEARQWRRLSAGMASSGAELLREGLRRLRLRRDRVRVESSDTVEISGLLSQIRAHEAALREIEGRLAGLEHSAAARPDAARPDPAMPDAAAGFESGFDDPRGPADR